MTPITELSEQSFLDLIAAVERAPDLPEQRRRHWICSLRQIAKWLDRPPAVIPARLSAVRISVGHLHHARLGVTAKTLANHKEHLRRFALVRQGAHRDATRCAPFDQVGEIL
jgi:hypothetical protein